MSDFTPNKRKHVQDSRADKICRLAALENAGKLSIKDGKYNGGILFSY